jgi:eukaryotic-like serine/threonine-protein kinase
MRCRRCDAEVDADGVDGLCPVCLFDAGAFASAEGNSPEFRYDLIEEIARGGMGVVYRAVQHGSQRQVAVKMILAEHATTAGALERFTAEVETIATLDHPNILPIYEAGETDGRPFYSMKFADGGTLRERIASFRGRQREAAQMMVRIARAVHHAHQRGILHRDLKPGNILLNAEATPFVADFGIAKWLERDNRLTIGAAALGTPHYMSPEQAAGAPKGLTTSADLYSLGAILYELLAGRPPFVADTSLETLRLVTQAPPTPLRAIEPSIPKDLEVICLKCLAKEPAGRYSSAAALADDLDRWLAGRTILARTSTWAERTWRWAKRNPTLASLSVTLLMVLIAAGIGLNISRNRAVNAERHALEELRTSSLAQARATRLGGRMGQRFDTLAALKRAADIRPGPDLRTEAFAALMLADIKVEKTWSDRHASNSPAAFDSALARYAVESEAGIVSLRFSKDQSEIARLASPEGNPRALYIAGWNADDSKIAVRFANDSVRVYETREGKLLFELTARPVCANARAAAYDFGFTPDGSELVVGLPGGGVSFHDAATGRENGRLTVPTVPAIVVVSNEGKVALVGKKNGTIEIYDRLSNGLEQILVHPSHLYDVRWRPGRSSQLAASCNDDNLYLWDAATGQQLRILRGHQGIPPLIAFHPAGKILASTARDYSVRFWDVENGECVINAHLYGEPCLRFSADGLRLALGSEGARLSTATVAMDAPCREFYHCDLSDWYSRISGLSMSRDGKLLAITLRSNGIHLLSAKNGALLADLPLWPGESKTAVFSPKSDALICSGQKSGLWKRTLRWTDEASLEIGPPELLDSRADFLVTDAQGDPPVAALYAEHLRRFSLLPLANPAQPIDLPVQSTPAGAFLTPDGRFAATNDWEGEVKGESDVRIWDAQTGQLVRRLEAGPNNSVKISQSGQRLVACGAGPGAGLWLLPDLFRTPDLQTAGDDAWFWPSGNLISILNNDALDLVSLRDGALLGSFPGDSAISVAIRPDQRKMFVGYGTHFFEWDMLALRRDLRAINLDWNDEPLIIDLPPSPPFHVTIREK